LFELNQLCVISASYYLKIIRVLHSEAEGNIINQTYQTYQPKEKDSELESISNIQTMQIL
jgi:hypothetical protein